MNLLRPVRTRYAPSPTGFQHIGGLRTALYCYLFAKKHQGTLVLRIEDTDQKRYVAGAEQYILDACQWVGIEFDESPIVGGSFGPYRQSERRHIYKEYIAILLQNGGAYYAFDSAESLEQLRQSHEAAGGSFTYNALNRLQLNNSLTRSADEVAELLRKGADYTVRLKTPEQPEAITFYDQVRGEVTFQSSEIDDKVLYKSDGWPTYHLANVVDDHLMQISHVVRGEEWLSSTPLHVLLYRYFGWSDTMPQFAHPPLLLNPGGRGKLSKRHADQLGFPVFPLAWSNAATGESSKGFREMGFRPAAFTNFLALLGWNDGSEREIFSMDELIAAFDLERVHKAGAKFDFDKAKWFNAQYLKNTPDEILTEDLLHDKQAQGKSRAFLQEAIGMYKDRLTFLHEFWENTTFLFEAPRTYDTEALRKSWKDDTAEHLSQLKNRFEQLPVFDAASVEQCIKDYAAEKNIKMGALMPPLRLALTGIGGGASLPHIAALIERFEVVKRIDNALQNWQNLL